MPRHREPDSFGFVVTDIARLIRAEMDRRIAEAGIGVTAGEARALSHAARAGAVRQTALAERMGVEAMTASGYLDRLEAQGLIERQPDPSDRRAKLVCLTDAAQDVLTAVTRLGDDLRLTIASTMSDADWRALNAGLLQVRDALASMRAENRESDAA